MSEHREVVVIGAGISGLAAVYYIKQMCPKARVIVLESANRIGGKIKTVKRDGFTIECGPEGFLARKPRLIDLIRAVGLGNRLVHSQPGASYIYVNRRLRSMPKGSVMGVPTRLLPMVTTGLIGPVGKLRAAMDLLIPRVHRDRDISLKTFFERRLGSEVVTNMIEPLLSGIYNGDLADMSLEATLPQFAAIEKKYRSLILGMKSLRPSKPVGKSKPSAGPFISLNCGLSGLAKRLAAAADDIRLNTQAVRVRPGKIALASGEVLHADAVIFAASPQQFGPLLGFSEAQSLSDDKRTSTATVALAFKKKDVGPFAGSGYVVSRKEGLHITACSFMDHKWPYAAPTDATLIRTYVGGAGDSSLVAKGDEVIEQTALGDLRKIGRFGSPLFSVITRQTNNMPQYTVGHDERVRQFERALEKMDGVYACGAMLHGVGLPDCVESAYRAAEQTMNHLKHLRN